MRTAFLVRIAVCCAVLCGAVRVDAAARPTGPNPLLQRHTFVVFDVETTGLSPENDRIVELGAVKIEHGIIAETQSWLINPQRPIPENAWRVHGIDDDMVRDLGAFADVYPAIRDFVGDAVLLAHNARFDRDFLYREVARIGEDPPANDVVDTLRLFRTWFPDAPSHSLGPLAALLHIDGGTFHRGLSDASYTAEIFLMGMDRRRAPRSLRRLLRAGGMTPSTAATSRNTDPDPVARRALPHR